MGASSWSLFADGVSVDLEVVGPSAKADGADRAETRRLIDRLTYDLRFGDPDARRVLLEVCAALGADSRQQAGSMDFGSPAWEPLKDALRDAADAGTVVVRRRARRSVVVPLDAPSEGVLGPSPESERVPDVWVLAASMTLLGDTPLINHAVRVLDPDTGEVVADGLRTDVDGIVRTEVPTSKIYRIEIVDRDPDLDIVPTVDHKHPVLRCSFVDAAGNPVPDLAVTVKDTAGQATDHTSDDDGLLAIPAQLGPYEVVIGDDSHWVHAVLARDGDADPHEIVVRSTLEDGGDGIDPDDRLARAWEDDGSDDDDGSGDDDGDGDSA